jgi:hypothetical protein
MVAPDSSKHRAEGLALPNVRESCTGVHGCSPPVHDTVVALHSRVANRWD